MRTFYEIQQGHLGDNNSSADATRIITSTETADVCTSLLLQPPNEVTEKASLPNSLGHCGGTPSRSPSKAAKSPESRDVENNR